MESVDRIRINVLVSLGEGKETFEAMVPIKGQKEPTRVVRSSLLELAKAIAEMKIPKNMVFTIPLGGTHAEAIIKHVRQITRI